MCDVSQDDIKLSENRIVKMKLLNSQFKLDYNRFFYFRKPGDDLDTLYDALKDEWFRNRLNNIEDSHNGIYCLHLLSSERSALYQTYVFIDKNATWSTLSGDNAEYKFQDGTKLMILHGRYRPILKEEKCVRDSDYYIKIPDIMVFVRNKAINVKEICFLNIKTGRIIDLVSCEDIVFLRYKSPSLLDIYISEISTNNAGMSGTGQKRLIHLVVDELGVYDAKRM